MSRTRRSPIFRFVVRPLVIAYLTFTALLYFIQGRLLYPAPDRFPHTTPAAEGLAFEDLQIRVQGSDHLHAWWIPAADPSEQVVLVFHGNGYVIEDMVNNEIASLRGSGANLLLTDYRGYGLSSRVSPDESTINQDADAALSYLLKDRKVPAAHIIVLGRSIGSGPATELARKNPGLGGLILETPFSRIDDAARGDWFYRLFPVSLILRSHFDNLGKIAAVHSPVLVIVGTDDQLTPRWMAESIIAQAHDPKQLCLVQGAGHNDLVSTGGQALSDMLRKFVQSIGTGSLPPAPGVTAPSSGP